MIVLAGTLRVGSVEHVEAVKRHMLRMQEASRQEAGCLHFTYLHDDADPCTFYVAEAWRTRRQLDRHGTRPHHREWRRAWPRYGVTLDHLTDAPLRVGASDELVAVGIFPPAPPAYPDHTLSAVTRSPARVWTAHCLAHGHRRSYGTAATAIDGAEHPAEWCAVCELSAAPSRVGELLPGVSRAAVVWGMFDATGVADDAGSEPPEQAGASPPRRLRAVATTRPQIDKGARGAC